MKRLRRIAAIFLALLLGLAAWFAVLLCYPTKSELRLARQLSTGLLVAHVPEPKGMLLGTIVFGRPQLRGRYWQPETGRSGPIPPQFIFAEPVRHGQATWQIRLDPRDKTWEIEVTEKRAVYLRIAGKSWRIGTKTRVWKTRRVAED